MQLVHVIPPKGIGDRHEERFPDTATPEQILAALTKPLKTNRGCRPLQDGYGPLGGDGLTAGQPYLSDPRTRVVIGKNEGGQFIEIKTIHGPTPTIPPAAQ